ncbi:hypothetical protein RHA1_ro11126 (plasmid) [Rhodococcus jostii RHA1]|uniref:Uncharacterized protein n=1 Tax=Rhodococcus jostii (strain RHA1) TaxID=101510 RepID=Q0RVB3_RHOJR|nr:hypothetical protein RHA1_ro11126 [Rhodococcus jostii RHA1]
MFGHRARTPSAHAKCATSSCCAGSGLDQVPQRVRVRKRDVHARRVSMTERSDTLASDDRLEIGVRHRPDVLGGLIQRGLNCRALHRYSVLAHALPFVPNASRHRPGVFLSEQGRDVSPQQGRPHFLIIPPVANRFPQRPRPRRARRTIGPVPTPRLPATAAASLRTHPGKILCLRSEHHVRTT